MTFDDYQTFVRSRMNKALTKKEALCNWAMGISGEGGETSELVKKHAFHGHELNVEKIKGEAGDVLFYTTALIEEVGLTLEDVLRHNVEKLTQRYPNGFSSADSINRKD